MMRFLDSAPLGEIRTTADGYKVAEVPVARTGIQDYAGREVGRADMAVVRMYRPPEAVFADSYLRSMAHKPITIDHPSDNVNSQNWKELSSGWTGETVRKDEAAGLVYVPMLFADQAAIDNIERDDRRQVSCGYTCDVEWTSGVTDKGEEYDAIQRPSALNHIALVSRGRAGSVCRVGDDWKPISKEPERQMKIVSYDSVPFEVADAALAGAFEKAISERDTARSAIADADRKAGEQTALVATRDGEIVALKAQLEDAKVTPEKLERMVADRAAVIDTAKKIAGDDLVTNGKSDADIRKAAVTKRLGDKTPTADAAIEGAFAVLAAAVSDADPLRDAIRDNNTVVTDGAKKAQSAYDKMVAGLEGGYKQKVNA